MSQALCVTYAVSPVLCHPSSTNTATPEARGTQTPPSHPQDRLLGTSTELWGGFHQKRKVLELPPPSAQGCHTQTNTTSAAPARAQGSSRPHRGFSSHPAPPPALVPGWPGTEGRDTVTSCLPRPCRCRLTLHSAVGSPPALPCAEQHLGAALRVCLSPGVTSSLSLCGGLSPNPETPGQAQSWSPCHSMGGQIQQRVKPLPCLD